MLVKNWMNQTVISLDVTDSIQTANQLFIKNRIRSLPVLENGKLVGIVSDRDLKKVLVSEDLGMDHNEIVYLNSAIKVKEIMTEDPVTVSPYVTVDEVAQKMFINKISGLPVVDKEGELVGIITQGDIFKLLISLTGIEKKGVQMAMQLKDELDSIKEIVDILRSYQGRVVSMLTSSKDIPSEKQNVYFRVSDLDLSKIEELKAELASHAILIYVVKHS
jgi:acetoin utilization protein AcuB